jgi:hypothetical protein
MLGVVGNSTLLLSFLLLWNVILLFIFKPFGVPIGALICQINSILSKTGKGTFLVIFKAFTLVISKGGVMVQTGTLQPGWLVILVKSLAKQGLLVVV